MARPPHSRPNLLARRVPIRPATVTLWDRQQRRYTIVRADDAGAELVAPADVVSLGEELVLGIGFAGGDIFATVRVVSMAPGRTHPKLARLRVLWRKFSGTDLNLTRRFFTERLGLSDSALGLPLRPAARALVRPIKTLGARRQRSRPVLATKSRQLYHSRPVTSGRERVQRSTRP